MIPQVGAVAPLFEFATAPTHPRRFSVRKHLSHIDEPTLADLSAIEAEMPLIDAELDVLAAEIANIYAADRGGPTPLDWRRLRRAEAAVTRIAAELADQPTTRRMVRKVAA
jgi:hypothetical protein